MARYVPEDLIELAGSLHKGGKALALLGIMAGIATSWRFVVAVDFPASPYGILAAVICISVILYVTIWAAVALGHLLQVVALFAMRTGEADQQKARAEADARIASAGVTSVLGTTR